MTVVSRRAAAALLLTASAAGSASTRPLPLAALTPAEVRAAGADGTGCSWMARKGGPVLLAMAGDKAVARSGYGPVALSPDARARDLFPFTFDRWRRDDLVIIVRKLGAARRRGTETLATRTDLEVIQGVRRTVVHGWLECGS